MNENKPETTLREYYAGLAMQAVLTNDALLHRVNDDSNDDAAPEFCVRWADMLIKALEADT